MPTRSPYWVQDLRDAQSGELDADAIRTVFGFDGVDFAKLSQDNKGRYPTSFEGMLYAQGCEVLTRLAQAVLRKVGPKPPRPDDDLNSWMHVFMFGKVDGLSQVARVRQGDAALILEEIYGGVRNDVFAVKREDDAEIADWLGFERWELAAIARTNGLALFEAIASAQIESGIALDRLSGYYQLAAGAPNHGQFAGHKMAAMCGCGGLRELFNVTFILAMKGLREIETSNFFDGQTVYHRPAKN